jgi:excinuclease ABC subunit C
MVAGMVVFKNGRPYKKGYRRFAIKDNLIQNDYGCMREVFERRFNEYLKGEDEEFSRLPDLIFVDGGKGQVNAVLPVLREMKIDLPVYGLVKDNKHRTRAISTGGGEISVSQNRAAFVLITKIQDEVHRFSISYMKSRHTKNSYSYELTKVRGIGEKKAQKLILKYKTKESLKQADPQELAAAAGIGIQTAQELYELIQKM